MQIIDYPQLSSEWFATRCGIPSASNFDKIVTSKGDPSKQAIKYMYRLAGEKVSESYEETYQNAAMLRGIEMESEARNLYEVINEVEVEEVGFCLHDDGFGCSPDGLVGSNGTVEIKCPLMATHVGYLLDNKLPTEYIQQVQGQLLVTGREYTDFVSYYPSIKPLIIRINRDEVFIKKLRVELELFVGELQELIKKIQ